MSKHNYTQYSNDKNDNLNDVNTYDAPVSYRGNVDVVEDSTVDSAAIKMEETTVKAATAPNVVTGVVANCTKLNVRAKPNASADVVCVLPAKAEVKITIDKSTADWFKVHTATGKNGYCMRKYVNAQL